MMELLLSMGPMYSEEGIECFADIVFSCHGSCWAFSAQLSLLTSVIGRVR